MNKLSAISLLLIACIIASCKHKLPIQEEPVTEDNYPPAISKIIQTHCATAGCHNAASYSISGGGLLMDSWEHMFNGGAHGAAVVPYSPENSALLYLTNQWLEFGQLAPPKLQMPYSRTPLTKEEYLTLRDWIASGAPDKDGNIPFATNPSTRQKIYMVHQTCDYIAVIDAEKQVVMRYIPVGKEYQSDQPHDLQVSPDGSYVYVSFYGSNIIQKIDTRTDSIEAEAVMSNDYQNIVHLSPDGSKLLVSDRNPNAVTVLNTATMQVINTIGGMVSPHGIATNATADTFYITNQSGNIVYVWDDKNGTLITQTIDGLAPQPNTVPGSPMPYRILMSPDYSQYFLTCAGTNDLRIIQRTTGNVTATIPVGKNPLGMAISTTQPYLFVSCMDDDAGTPNALGSVYVINYLTNQVVKVLDGRFSAPHGITIDDRNGRVYIFSRNISNSGPPPHHGGGVCGDRPGYYRIYDLKTLQPLNNKFYEVLSDPYSADVRFK